MLFRAGGDYAQDSRIHEGMEAGIATHDEAKRDGIYRRVFDLNNEQLYVLPIVSLPVTYAHRAEVRREPNLISETEVHVSDWFWN